MTARIRVSSPKVSETAIVKECLDYLAIRKIFAWRNNSGATRPKRADGTTGFLRFGYVGSSDILGILPGGRFLAVECKAKGGKLSDAQQTFLTRITESGGLAIVAYSYADIFKAFKEAMA